MKSKVLIVDDDKNLLDSMRRGLFQRYDLQTAVGPEEGLRTIKEKGPFAVVLSDMRMPGMDGVRFLEKVKEISPLSVRMMLTGHGDLDVAMEAVNDGGVFRFMAKPCPMEKLIRSLDAGVEQYRLVTAEKDLLRGTLRGCIKVLIDILNLVSPEAFSRGERVTRLLLAVVKKLGLPNALKFELAGLLSQIGMVAVPQDIVLKHFRGEITTAEEVQIYRMHTTVASSLLSQIPRLDEVVRLVGSQKDSFTEAAPMPTDAILLNLCLEYIDLENKGLTKDAMMEELRLKWEAKAPTEYKALLEVVYSDTGYIPGKVALKHLRTGMILKQDIVDGDGILIMAKGQEVSEVANLRIFRMRESFKMPEMVEVLIPLEQAV